MIPHHFNNRTLAFFLNAANIARSGNYMERNPGYDYYLLGGILAVFIFLLLILVFIRCSVVHLPVILGYADYDLSRSPTTVSVYSFDGQNQEKQLMAFTNGAYSHHDFQPSLV